MNFKFVVICNFPPSIINFRGKLLEAIASKGYEIYILSPNLQDFPNEAQFLSEQGYHLIEIPMQRTGMNPLSDLKMMWAIYKTLKEVKADYVLAYTIKPVIYGMSSAWFANVPKRFALITGLGYAFQSNDKPTKLQKIIRHMYKFALARSSKVFFQNPDDKALFKALNLIPNTPSVIVNGSGVHLSKFNVVELPLNDTGYPKASFLLIARLLVDKGIREYFNAAKEIKKIYPQAEFHLVGWIDSNPSSISQSELNEWIQSGIIHFWGKLSDVRPAIVASSIYVLPSYREGTPRTVLEAMAMGRAIITTDAPGCRETVVNGENGYLVEVQSVDSLQQAMEKFILNPSLIIEMGKRSRELVAEKYDVNKVNQHMIQEMEI
ncbi:glycosyltransferase family 4 protein [Suttonella indologenes]|uniref:Colanic acid biosynthesis glycosyltransferase WcaL n=1 Tax=Suttonella indologenes TaxID=13276 RepID=A0A380MZC2_9GAMM|nr:glycosyltransferase family 4 protein [Suttonella indologenes]SUO97909.1 colanic acid biosynthesis glycosyltransferase WcaL [Suttonella indologenes]